MEEYQEPQEQQEDEGLYEHRTIQVDPGQSPLRIDKFIHLRLENVSRNKIQNAIRAGSVRVDDKVVKANHKVKPNQTISLVFPRPPKTNEGIVPENIPLDIRYEDDDVMIIHKPAGMVVHPGIGTPNGTLVNALAYYFRRDDDLPILPGNAPDRPGLVHRIDKDTTGLMVIAKNDFAMTHLAKQFFDHTIERKYLALVWGQPDDLEGTITGNVGRHPRFRQLRTVFPDGEQGKHAITHYKVIEPLYYVSLVECQLETGRTHQIRVHMKHHGHTLFADAKYGGDKILKGTVFSKYKQFVENCFKLIHRQALHAAVIGFTHPTTGEHMRFEADLPEDFQSALDKWRKYVSGRKELMNP